MDLPSAHSYESISGSVTDDYELRDNSRASPLRSHEDDREGLLRGENNREDLSSA